MYGLSHAGDEREAMHHFSLKGISDLEDMAKARLQKDDAGELARLRSLDQLIRYGVCTCQCHFSTNVVHSAAPCCGNAKLKAAT
jgi:hypothetical protein